MRVDGFAIERFASERVGFHEMYAFGVAKIAEPERGKITQIAKAALGGKHGKLELVFVEIGFGGDFERAAIVFCAADDDERAVDGLFLRFDAKHGEFVLQDFEGALPPVGEDSHFRFQFEVYGVSDAAIRAGAGDAEKVTSFLRLLDGSCEAQRNFADRSANEAFGGARNVPGKSQFLGENVCGAARK